MHQVDDEPPSFRFIWRLIFSAVVVVGDIIINFLVAPVASLAAGRLAGMQFENSDVAYATAIYGMGATKTLGLSSAVVLVVLLIVWFRPLRLAIFGAIGVAFLFVSIPPAEAYYNKTDYTEVVTIYPNETAFWIPDTGGNRDSQGKMDSAEYYQNNKVALLRFIIPHTVLSGSGWGPWGNYVVPAGRLILVDRTPYTREWVKSEVRGTSTRDQSFPCQDNQGKDVTVEMTIGTSVFPENAAKFLYRFGVVPPPGDRSQPDVVFTSVFYGRSLADVMDNFGRGALQALVCSQVSTRDIDKVNADAAAMLLAIKADATNYFAPLGITLDYIGWAGTFTFSDGVQGAIDRSYIATKDRAIAEMLQPYAATIQALAAADALRSFGAHTDGKLPTTIVGLPPQIGNLIDVLLSAVPSTHGTPSH